MKLNLLETEPFAARGVKVGDTAPVKIPFPCPVLSGTCCTIYQDRPQICRDYRCEVLDGLSSGKLDQPAALSLIETARELESAVEALLPPGQSIVEARCAWQADPQFWQALPVEERDAALKLVMAMAALNLHLDRHFRSEKKRVIRGG